MPLDTNGVWQFTETDAEATASDLLNLLAASTSDRVGDLDTALSGKQDSLGDTGWVNVTIASGFAAHTGFTPQVRRIGKQVFFRGGWSNTGLSASQNNVAIGSLPAGFYPSSDVYFVGLGSSPSSANNGRYNFTTTGAVRLSTAATLSGYFLLATSWLTD